MPDVFATVWTWISASSVVDWIAALATPIAFIALLHEARLSRLDRKETATESLAAKSAETRRELESQVAAVTCWITVHENDGHRANVSATVDNSSDAAIFDLSARLTASSALNIEPKTLDVVPPGMRVDLPAWISVSAEGLTSSLIEISFDDARGVRWERSAGTFRRADGTT